MALRLSEGLGPAAPMERLLAFCDWERKHKPHPDGKPHVAEWAAAEIERLAELADSEGSRAVNYLRRARAAETRIARLTEWMVEQGLLHYHDHCKRPDGSNGPAWVVRKPATVWGDACEAWHATSAAGAVEDWLAGPNVPVEPGAL